MRSRLLGCLAKAIAKNGVKFLCGLVPGGEVLFDIASDVWQDYCQGRQEGALRTELGELAQAPAAEVRQEAQQAAQAAAAHLPADARLKIAAYLSQVPGMIRRSLRRPSDPTGTTVPATLSLRSPEDLMPFLPPNAPRFQPGMRPLPGVDWVLEEPLGVGGFGEVWKAHHAHLTSKPPVALKFCLDPSAARVLRNEAGVLDRLMQHGRQHGIVPLLDAYLDADPPCLVYEYVEGGDMTGLIREMHAQRGLSVATANRLLLRLAEIIAVAHRADPAIVHDDLKPSNILIRRVEDGLKLYVTDYGIGGLAVSRAVRQTQKPANSREQLLTEAVRGAYTPLYASPQQMARRRDEPADPRDDVHALGVIWYQLVTGDLTMLRVPADWTEELRGRGLREELIGLLGTCLASKAEKRPASAGILAAELRTLTKPAVKPEPPTPPGPVSPPEAEKSKDRKPEPEREPRRSQPAKSPVDEPTPRPTRSSGGELWALPVRHGQPARGPRPTRSSGGGLWGFLNKPLRWGAWAPP